MRKLFIVLVCFLCTSSAGVIVLTKEVDVVKVVEKVPIVAIPAIYAPTVMASAEMAGMPAWILARVIEKESKWKPNAVGKNRNGTKDLGIAQFNSAYLTDFYWFDNGGQEFDPFVPEEAIPVAAKYLKRLHKATGDWWMAVAAYECGLTKVRQNRIPEQTIRNTNRVMYGWYLDNETMP